MVSETLTKIVDDSESYTMQVRIHKRRLCAHCRDPCRQYRTVSRYYVCANKHFQNATRTVKNMKLTLYSDVYPLIAGASRFRPTLT